MRDLQTLARGILDYLRQQQQFLDRLFDFLARSVNDRHGAGTLANRPPAGTAGRVYLATDTTPKRLWVDDGSAWYGVDVS